MARKTSQHVRSTGRKAALVLEHLAEERRRSVDISEDRPWLEEISSHPNSLLEGMADSHLLYRINRGRYLVAPAGSFSANQAAPVELIAALLLRSQGDYYLGYLTALIGHRLTDLHSTTVYAAIRQATTFTEVEVDLPAGTLRVVRLSDSRWPKEDGELERVRALPDSKEFIWRATLERTLVDALARPELAGGIETVIGSWARAKQRNVDWERVCAIGIRQGKSMTRRIAFVLRLIGLPRTARQNLPGLNGRGASTPLDRSRAFALEAGEAKRDRETGVLINVPEDYLAGWVGSAQVP